DRLQSPLATAPTSRGEELAVGTEDDLGTETRATDQSAEETVLLTCSPSPRVPQPHCPITSGRCQPSAIRAKRHTANTATVVQREGFLPRLSFERSGVPDPNRLVPACRDQPVPLVAKLYAAHLAPMLAEGEHVLTGLEIPELDGFIRSRRGETATIGTEYRAVDHMRMAAQDLNLLACPRVPDL